MENSILWWHNNVKDKQYGKRKENCVSREKDPIFPRTNGQIRKWMMSYWCLIYEWQVGTSLRIWQLPEFQFVWNCHKLVKAVPQLVWSPWQTPNSIIIYLTFCKISQTCDSLESFQFKGKTVSIRLYWDIRCTGRNR